MTEANNVVNRPRVAMVRSVVERQSYYGNYRDVLRRDCWYACAYCSISEAEAAGVAFEIDHYNPLLDDREDYSNLFWSCELCNNYKSDFWVLSEDLRSQGHAILRIDQQHPSDHLKLEGLRVGAKSQAGDTSIKLLRLNRKMLRDLRSARADLKMGQEMIMSGLRELFGTQLSHLSHESRLNVLAIRRRVTQKVDVLCSSIEELVEFASRSSFLDKDPGSEEDRQMVREYLNEVSALGPELTTLRRAERRMTTQTPKHRGSGRKTRGGGKSRKVKR